MGQKSEKGPWLPEMHSKSNIFVYFLSTNFWGKLRCAEMYPYDKCVFSGWCGIGTKRARLVTDDIRWVRWQGMDAFASCYFPVNPFQFCIGFFCVASTSSTFRNRFIIHVLMKMLSAFSKWQLCASLVWWVGSLFSLPQNFNFSPLRAWVRRFSPPFQRPWPQRDDQFHILELPRELIGEIFKHVDYTGLLALRKVSPLKGFD